MPQEYWLENFRPCLGQDLDDLAHSCADLLQHLRVFSHDSLSTQAMDSHTSSCEVHELKDEAEPVAVHVEDIDHGKHIRPPVRYVR